MDEEPKAPPPRRSVFSLFLAVVAIAGSAVGVFVYQMMQGQKKSDLDASGFDVSQVTEQAKAAASSGGSHSMEPQSSMMQVQTGLPGMKFGTKTGSYGGSPQEQAKKSEDSFTQMVRNYEPQARAFAIAWTKKSVVLQQYGRDWMSYPDLKKLNDDYMRDHDPVAFMHGLAHSDNFGKMVSKYAGQSAIQSFAKEAFHQAPGDLTNAALGYANKDGTVKGMMDKVMNAMGLPPGMLGGGGQVDSNQIMDSVMKGNPQMQQAMQANPGLQQQIQAATPKQQ